MAKFLLTKSTCHKCSQTVEPIAVYKHVHASVHREAATVSNTPGVSFN